MQNQKKYTIFKFILFISLLIPFLSGCNPKNKPVDFELSVVIYPQYGLYHNVLYVIACHDNHATLSVMPASGDYSNYFSPKVVDIPWSKAQQFYAGISEYIDSARAHPEFSKIEDDCYVGCGSKLTPQSIGFHTFNNDTVRAVRYYNNAFFVDSISYHLSGLATELISDETVTAMSYSVRHSIKKANSKSDFSFFKLISNDPIVYSCVFIEDYADVLKQFKKELRKYDKKTKIYLVNGYPPSSEIMTFIKEFPNVNFIIYENDTDAGHRRNIKARNYYDCDYNYDGYANEREYILKQGVPESRIFRNLGQAYCYANKDLFMNTHINSRYFLDNNDKPSTPSVIIIDPCEFNHDIMRKESN